MSQVPLAPASAPTSLWVVLGLAAAASTVPVFLPGSDEGLARLLPLVITAGLFAALLLLPRRLTYTLTPDSLVVTHLTGKTTLPYAGMTAWQTAGHLGLKVGGTGLPGYYAGHYVFHADGLKGVLAASSATHGGVIVQEGGKAYFLTPADPAGFLAELARRGVTLRPR